MIHKIIPVFALFLLLASCSENAKIETTDVSKINETESKIPEKTINKSELYYDTKTSSWLLNNQAYSGYAVVYSKDSTLLEKFGILNGKKHKEAIIWYPDRHYKSRSHYHYGKLHGEKKNWSSDSTHILLAQLNYHLGKAHGEQKKWYSTGEAFIVLNLNMGKEEGMQQAFRKNGDLYANYEAREGRIFGLKKSALCFGLKEQELNAAD